MATNPTSLAMGEEQADEDVARAIIETNPSYIAFGEERLLHEVINRIAVNAIKAFLHLTSAITFYSYSMRSECQ